MPSSTSSSENPAHLVRPIPGGAWLLRLGVAASITIAILGVWEARVRQAGYAPTLNDTGDLWAAVRGKVAEDPDGFVVIGSSRIWFDLELDALAAHYGCATPVQLGQGGGRPLAILEDVAAEPTFRGTLLCGVVPPLYFAPAGFPADRADEAVARYHDQSPSQWFGHLVARAFQERFAFINQEDLTLDHLLRHLAVPDRDAARPNQPPAFPPYFAWLERTRQARMWELCDFGTPLARRIQEIWIPLFTPPPPPPGVSAEDARAGYEASMESILERTRVAVETIEARGGRVVFIRCPSTGTVLELENQFAPRAGFWDRILAVSGAPGIHYADHEALSGFDCPEWSHLKREDAQRFTHRLLPILDGVLATYRAGAE